MSLFNRPAWAKSQTPASTDDTSGSIFSHADRSYLDIVAEQERKKQAKLEKKKLKEERRTSAKRDSNTYYDEGATSKRRRMSVDYGVVEDDQSDLAVVQDTSFGEHEHAAESSLNAPRQHSLRQKHAKPSEIVDLGSSENEEAHSEQSAAVDIDAAKLSTKARRTEREQPAKAVPQPIEVVDDESDDEFVELARRARQERQQKSQQATKSRTPDIATQPLSPGPEDLDTGQHSLPTPPPDPPVQLFITSRLPNTREMIVFRKLSQNLADVRKVWCKKQNFTDEQTQDVFFIHRMRRVYDVTTCKSLGLEVDSFGNVTLRGAESKEDVDKIHLEAVTDALYQQIKAEKSRESQNGHNVPAGVGAEGDDAEPEQPQEESFIRLVLKANKKPDFKLKVKPTTTFAKIVSAFAKTNLEAGESAYLAFDGERLDPNDEVQTTDISDMDCIEVHTSST